MDPSLDAGAPITAEASLLLVPRAPGPLLTVDLVMGRPRDDLDALIDDVFGEPIRERPGMLDIVLVVAGMALIAWTLLGASPLAAIIGAVMLILGLALPTRDALNAIRIRRAASRKERARARGMLLDVGQPATRRLTDSYTRLLSAAARPGLPDSDAAVAAGHLAVTEVASLLHGEPPRVAAEVEYVDRRTEAIKRLAAEFEASAERAAAWAKMGEQQESVTRATLVTEAREELGSVGGLGSLEQLDALAGQLHRESIDAGT